MALVLREGFDDGAGLLAALSIPRGKSVSLRLSLARQTVSPDASRLFSRTPNPNHGIALADRFPLIRVEGGRHPFLS
jgi:hypothetical protein